MTRKDAYLTREEVSQMITLYESVCIKLKEIYFKEKKWPECSQFVSNKLNELKTKARKFFVDRSEVEIARTLRNFKQEDIIDLMNHPSVHEAP